MKIHGKMGVNLVGGKEQRGEHFTFIFKMQGVYIVWFQDYK